MSGSKFHVAMSSVADTSTNTGKTLTQIAKERAKQQALELLQTQAQTSYLEVENKKLAEKERLAGEAAEARQTLEHSKKEMEKSALSVHQSFATALSTLMVYIGEFSRDVLSKENPAPLKQSVEYWQGIFSRLMSGQSQAEYDASKKQADINAINEAAKDDPAYKAACQQLDTEYNALEHPVIVELKPDGTFDDSCLRLNTDEMPGLTDEQRKQLQIDLLPQMRSGFKAWLEREDYHIDKDNKIVSDSSPSKPLDSQVFEQLKIDEMFDMHMKGYRSAGPGPKPGHGASQKASSSAQTHSASPRHHVGAGAGATRRPPVPSFTQATKLGDENAGSMVELPAWPPKPGGMGSEE